MTSSPRRADTASCPEFVPSALFTKLLTETCVETSKKAIKCEGPVAIQAAFQVLGQVAAGERFAHPDVTRVMSGLEEFLDGKKLEALVQ